MDVQDLRNNAVTNHFTKIAHEYGSTQSRVERHPQRIEQTWTRGKNEKLDALFKTSSTRKKPPEQFLIHLSWSQQNRDVTLAVK
jgi:hypothetical protein